VSGRIGERDPVTGRIVGKAGGTAKPDGGDGGEPIVDPVEAGAGAGTPTEPAPRAKRGRPPSGGSGSGAGTASAKKASPSLDLSGLAGVWAVMHVQMARLADCPELAMTEADAKTLFGAAQNVLRHYSIQSTQKTIDWLTFGSVAVFMYTPRFVALSKRRRNKPPPRQPEYRSGPAQVFQFTPPSPPSQAQASPMIEPEIMEPVH
jgi:hypothetical protein